MILMSDALWKGLVGALSVAMFFGVIYLYKGIRYLIKNPYVFKEGLSKTKQLFRQAWFKTRFVHNKETALESTPALNSKVVQSHIFPRWAKNSIICICALLGTAGLGYCCYRLYDDVISPFINNKHDERLIARANKNPSLADSIAVVLATTRHYCNYGGWENHKSITDDLLLLGARNGSVMAQVHLGKLYESFGIKTDWYDPFSDIYNHNKYKGGMGGTIEDLQHAAYWFQQASNAGNMEARGRLGVCYALGNGVEYLPMAGERMIKESADSGNARFQYIWGNRLARGVHGVFIDEEGNSEYFVDEPRMDEAKQYWQLAADQGIEEAKLKLEKIY